MIFNHLLKPPLFLVTVAIVYIKLKNKIFILQYHPVTNHVHQIYKVPVVIGRKETPSDILNALPQKSQKDEIKRKTNPRLIAPVCLAIKLVIWNQVKLLGIINPVNVINTMKVTLLAVQMLQLFRWKDKNICRESPDIYVLWKD